MAFEKYIRPFPARTVIFVGMAGILTAGCGSYFSEDWPKLTAPSPAVTNPPQVSMSFVAPPSLYRNTGLLPAGSGTVTQRLAALAARFQDLSAEIEGQQARYEDALAQMPAKESGEDRAQRWITAQLELTRLSQTSNGLDDILAAVDALLLSGPQEKLPAEPARNLWDRVFQKETELNRYLKRQRLELAALE